MTAIAAMLVVPVAGSAAPGHSSAGSGTTAKTTLLQLAAANPDQVFDVIVQTRPVAGKGRSSDAIDAARSRHPGKAHGVKKQFGVISGAAAELTGAQIADLAARKDVVAITEDVAMVATANDTTSTTTCTTCPFEGVYWPYVTGVTGFWPKSGRKAQPAPQAPAIAIVDSGVDASNAPSAGAWSSSCP